jgi:23S rRNA pseudouridine1911/1915/1917 synthase
MSEPKVIYEDKFLMVLDKPPGWVVNKAATTRRQQTIQDWLPPVSGKKESDFVKREGIVHRLDKETSGLLIVAKKEDAFEDLQRQFKARSVLKKYLCLVHGKPRPEKGEIRAPLMRHPYNRKKFGVFLGGREAETMYKVIKDFGGKFSLVEMRPKTGRTHQIRVHLKYLGHPVVGDKTYAGRKTGRLDREWCPRQFLHAFYIKFTHPISKKELVFKTDLPHDLKKILKNLEEGEHGKGH